MHISDTTTNTDNPNPNPNTTPTTHLGLVCLVYSKVNILNSRFLCVTPAATTTHTTLLLPTHIIYTKHYVHVTISTQ